MHSTSDSGNSLRNVWLKYHNFSTGSGMFSGDQPSEKASKRVRSMGSFEYINRTGIFSIRLAQNLSLDDNIVVRAKSVEKGYD